jgi:hypothetical protein
MKGKKLRRQLEIRTKQFDGMRDDKKQGQKRPGSLSGRK